MVPPPAPQARDEEKGGASYESPKPLDVKKRPLPDRDEWEDSPSIERDRDTGKPADDKGSETTSLLDKAEVVPPDKPDKKEEDDPSVFSPSVIVAFISAISAALYITGNKIATSPHISPGSEVTFAHLMMVRGFFGLLLISYEVYVLEQTPLLTPPGPANGWQLVALAGVITAAGSGAGLYAVSEWSAPDVATIVNTSPALTVVVTAMMGLEALDTKSCIGLFAAMTGVALISKPTFIFGGHVRPGHEFKFLPFLAAFGQATCQVITNLMIRKVQGASAAAITYYVNLFMCLQGLMLVGIHGHVWPTIGEYWVPPVIGILMTVLFGTSMNYFKNMALRMSKSILVVGLRFLVPVLCVITSFLFLNKDPTWFTIMGAICVVIGGVIILLAKREREAAKKAGSAQPVLLSPVEIDYISTPELKGKQVPIYPAVWQHGDTVFSCLPSDMKLDEEGNFMEGIDPLPDPIPRINTVKDLATFGEYDGVMDEEAPFSADDLESPAGSRKMGQHI